MAIPPAKKVMKPRAVLRNNQIEEADDSDVDYDIMSPNHFFGSHINLIPLQSAVQGPRLFYGARFYNQAMPVKTPEAPLVQNLSDDDPDGRSFDEILGRRAGAVFAEDDGGKVTKITPDGIHYQTPDGKKKVTELYDRFSFNRKTAIHNTPLVKVGDVFKKGQLLARSNYTDDKGTLAMGLNAKVGLVPYKGYSMDDAVVISNSFAQRLASEHSDMLGMDFDNGVKSGKNHYVSLFPEKYTKEQLALIDDDGAVLPGTKVKPGDPLVLASKPRVLSSATSDMGKLSKVMRQSRNDASQTWDEDVEGVVTDVAKTRHGVKVVVASSRPTQVGDKIVFRSGNKGVVSHIIPDEQMPRTAKGEALEVLLNELGLPSRANNSLPYEMLIGKVAKKIGQSIKVPSFNKPGEKYYEDVQKLLEAAGLTDTEEIFDPQTNRKLENPVTVGDAYVLKLHHTSASKASARGQGGYDNSQQPLKGGGEGAKSKRLSGLEINALLSAGAYQNLKEGSTIRGQKNDEYWRALRQGHTPKQPGAPFVWDKFQALLNGAGLHARKIDDAHLRLGPFIDRDLDDKKAVEVKNGELVDLNTMEPVAGGLFDRNLMSGNRWGKITLPIPIINPAMEDQVRQLLGITKKQMREIIAGRAELPEHLR